MRLVFLGAPGAGKGTQAEILSRKLDIPTISTGHILRTAIKNETPVGLEARAFMDRGELVPDNVVIRIIKERLSAEDCQKGWILDGVPRTIVQAEALEAAQIRIDAAIVIELPEEEILHRMEGRRVCEACGATYNVESVPPRVEGICDKCGGKLIQRKDDNPETIKARFEVYHRETAPLVGYYAQRGLLKSVESTCNVEGTATRILAAIGVED